MNRPDWWITNQRLRRALELPKYEPPRFEDGTYTYEIVAALEEKYDCTIHFMGLNTRYGDKWEVRIGTEHLMQVSRRRDQNGNTVYGISSDEFRSHVESFMRNRDD